MQCFQEPFRHFAAFRAIEITTEFLFAGMAATTEALISLLLSIGNKSFGWVSTLCGTHVVPRLLQEMSERFQRRFGNVVLNSLGVGLGNLGWDT